MASRSKKRELVCKLGKAQARAQFAPLVEALATNGGVIEITDYGKVSAVMLGYNDYMLLLAKANESFKQFKQFKQSRALAGSMTIVGDLEEATKEISAAFATSIKKTAIEL